MILDIEIVSLGDNVYAAKLKHERLGLLKSIVEAKSYTDAKNKINLNMKQAMWKKGTSSRECPVHFHFIAKSLDNKHISIEDTPDNLKQYHPDYENKDDPKIWSLEEIIDEHGKISYRTVKHDHPLMSKMEVQEALMAKMFK